MKFACGLIDPPWSFKTYSKKSTRLVEKHYDTMTDDDLVFISSTMGSLFTDNAIVFMWATWPKLPSALTLLSTMGFDYKTGIPWIKRKNDKTQIGLGYRFRNCSEILLVGTRGKVPKPSTTPIGLIDAPRTKHSRKPDEQYRLAEMYPGPYVELFARPHDTLDLSHWTQLGYEMTGKDIVEDIVDTIMIHK